MRLKLQKKNKFPMKEAYLAVVENYDNVKWRRIIWGSRHVPKASLIAWFCAMDMLAASDRVTVWKEEINKNYVLCKNEEETRKHLFFQCSFSGRVLPDALKEVRVRHPPWHGICCVPG